MSTLPSIDTLFSKKDMQSGFCYWNDPSAFHSSTSLPFDMARNGMMTYTVRLSYSLIDNRAQEKNDDKFTDLEPQMSTHASEPLYSPVSPETEHGAPQDMERPTSPGLEKVIGFSMLISEETEQQGFEDAGPPIEYIQECYNVPSTTHTDFDFFLYPSSSSCPSPVPEAFTILPPSACDVYSTDRFADIYATDYNSLTTLPFRDNSNPGANLFSIDAQRLVYAHSQADSLMLTLPLSTTEFAPSLSSTTPPMPTPILKALLNAPPLYSTPLDSPEENNYGDMQTITSSPSPVDSPIESPAVSGQSSVESMSDSDDSVEVEKTTSAQSTVTIRSSSSSPSFSVSTKQSNGCLTLWAFIARIALNPAKKGIVVWTGEGYQFRIVNPLLFCKAWSRHQGRADTTPWSSVQRAIRLSYGKRKRVGMIVNDLKSRRDRTWTFVNELPQVLFVPKEALDDYIYAHNEKGPLTNGHVALTRTLHPYVHSSVFPLKSFLDQNGEPFYPCDSLIDIVKNASMSIPLIPSIYDQSIFNAYEQNYPGPMYGYSLIESNPHCLYNPY